MRARITLRKIAEVDLPEIGGWWPEAAATVRGTRDPVDASELRDLIADNETLAIALAGDPVPIGLVAYTRPSDGWLDFTFLALAEGRRGWGYGSEALRAIEEGRLAERCAARIYRANGLGLYFWTRVGYRPAVPGELPWQERDPDAMISVVRSSVSIS